MNSVLDFANTLGHAYKFDSCEKIIKNLNGSDVYVVNSKDAKGLCLGFPVLIRVTDNHYEEVIKHKEILKLLNISNK